jgi:hypothetical protein
MKVLCRLFGHKFMKWMFEISPSELDFMVEFRISPRNLPQCVRCGAPNPKPTSTGYVKPRGEWA